MYQHHEESINNITEKLKTDNDILAVIVGGSIAHQYEKENSDVDIMIVVTEKAYDEKVRTGCLHYFEREACTYEDGYIDGKYITLSYLKEVRDKGNQPSRYAFEGCRVTYSKIENINDIIRGITKYNKDTQLKNIRSFFAQMKAWFWYIKEAKKHDNDYLLMHSISQFVLFSGRIILEHNEMLYPYHKWFLRVLESAKDKPVTLLEDIHQLMKNKEIKTAEKIINDIEGFADWNIGDDSWPSVFIKETEQAWMVDKCQLSDL